MSTPLHHSAQATLRELMRHTTAGLVRMILDRCETPWVRDAFAASSGDHPAERLGIYWLNGPDDVPWPAAALSIARVVPGRSSRVAVGLITYDPKGVPIVSGRDITRIKKDRLTEWGTVLKQSKAEKGPKQRLGKV